MARHSHIKFHIRLSWQCLHARWGDLPPASQSREPLCQAQGLASCRNPLRPMRPHILLSHVHRRRRHLL